MKKNFTLLSFIMVFWFVISFITNILGPLIPDIIKNFNLNHLAMAGFIPTSFFIAYAIMSIPAGIMIDKIGDKKSFIYRILNAFLRNNYVCLFSFLWNVTGFMLYHWIGHGNASNSTKPLTAGCGR